MLLFSSQGVRLWSFKTPRPILLREGQPAYGGGGAFRPCHASGFAYGFIAPAGAVTPAPG